MISPGPTRWLATAVAFVVVATAACGDSSGPGGQFAGGYELSLVNGQTLPSRYKVYGFGATKFMLSGQLDFSGSNRITDLRHWEHTLVGGLPEEFDYQHQATYRVEGDFMIITRPSSPGTAGGYADTALINGNILIVPVRTVDGTEPQVASLTYVKR